jgi:5'-nucleotidase (lipoprotein e(P4) family)
VNHWKSRFGGEFDTAEKRTLCAARTYQLYQEIVREQPDAEVLLTGDFNDYPTSLSLSGVLQAHANPDLVRAQTKPTRLYNATSALDRQGQGTYCYEGSWGFLDQLIVSRGLLDDQGLSYLPGSLHVYNPDGRLLKDGAVRGFDPGKGDLEGCSDHLPLVAELVVRQAGPPLARIAREQELTALLWQQTAGEYRALCYQAFAGGLAQVERMLAHRGAEAKPPAIIVDLDETILDNSPYQAQSAIDGFSYPSHWSAWVAQSEAPAVPGAVGFLAELVTRNVEVFYVTNRREAERAATLDNLRRLGLPDADDAHLLPRQETSSKEARRQAIRARFDVLLLVGDNLADFAADYEGQSSAARARLVDEQRTAFGQRYLVLPNPIYGDWETTLYGADYALPEAEKQRLRLAHLRGFPVPEPVVAAPALAAIPAAAPADPLGEPVDLRLNLNTATVEQLIQAKGIGTELARRVVEHRQAHGPFRAPADLLHVKGIGQVTLAALLQQFVVQPE